MKHVNKKFIAGYVSYKENEILNIKIQKIRHEKNLRKEKVLLLKLQKEGFHSELSKHHIQYYINDCIARQKEKKKRIILSIGTVFIIIGAIFLTLHIYQRLYNIRINNETYIQAVKYYEKKDYDASEKRLQELINANWDGYGIFHYESLISEKKKDYETACNAILYFLNNYYGLQNITENNTAYKRLMELDEQYIDGNKNSGLSNTTVKKLQNTLSLMEKYSNQEYNIASYIYKHNWKRALYYSKLLIREGACNYNLCVQYIFSLMQTNEYEKAEQYLNTYLSSMSDYEKHTIMVTQIKTLIKYVEYENPNLMPEEADLRVKKYMDEYSGGSENNTWEGTPYEIYLSSNTFKSEVLPYLQDFLKKINYWDALDNIEITDYSIVEGTDGYCVTLTKNETQEKHEFFISRNGKFIYIFVDGKWINLTEHDFSSGFDLEAENNLSNFYNEDPVINSLKFVNSKNKDISMTIQFSDNKNNYFFKVIFKKNNKVIFTTESQLYDNQFTFPITAGIAGEDFGAQAVLGNRLVLLINKDITSKYSMLEGLYNLTCW